MRIVLMLVVIALLAAPAAYTRAADLAPLLPDKTWMVLGVEVKGMHESPLGKKLFGKDNRLTAFRKLFGAFDFEDGVALLKSLEPLETCLNSVTRITVTFTPGSKRRDSDGIAILLEGEFDDAEIATGIKACCKLAKVPYKTEKIDERTVHIAAGYATVRTVRLDKTTVAIAFTADAITDLFDRQNGKLKSKAPRAIVEAVRKINPAATPLWLVVGENRDDEKVEYARMIATFSLGVEAKLSIRMEAPDAEAAGRCKKTLEFYANILSAEKEQEDSRFRLVQELCASAKVEITGTNTTATATIPDRALVAEYAKQK
jgi:hypothetical protein